MSQLARISVLSVIALWSLSTSVKADTTAVDFTSPISFTSFGDFNLGWQFQATQAITVTALGYYNAGGDSHQVGIYALGGGSPLVTATITSADTPYGNWHFESLTSPLVLSAGTYRIVGQSKSTSYAYEVNGLSVDPRIQLQNGYFAGGGALAYPTTATSWAGYFGPNFQLASPPPSAVPEPGTGMLMGVALALSAIVSHRTRR